MMLKVPSFTGRIAVAIGLCALLSACTPIRSLASMVRSTDKFAPFPSDGRVRVEPGADRLAAMLSPFVATSVKTVETSHKAPFKSSVEIYVCASDVSYYQLTGQRSPAVTTHKLFLSPSVFQGQRPIDRYLTHELSHLHIVQSIGVLGATRLPEWFKEGVAEMVSGGATSSFVAASDALKAIRDGRHFIPDHGRSLISSFLFPHYGAHWGIENRMFYRQSMLFTQFMRDRDNDAFQSLLVAVERGDDFQSALQSAYPEGIQVLWSKFVDTVATTANQAL